MLQWFDLMPQVLGILCHESRCHKCYTCISLEMCRRNYVTGRHNSTQFCWRFKVSGSNLGSQGGILSYEYHFFLTCDAVVGILKKTTVLLFCSNVYTLSSCKSFLL